MRSILLALILMVLGSTLACAADRIPLTVEEHAPGAPLTVGLPFPKGALHSPDNVRVLTEDGEEIPSQITPVTTWAPADSSLKWIWVFFFATDGDSYQVEYGEDVDRAPLPERLTFVNNQRPYGETQVDTGPLRLQVDKRNGNGFLDRVSVSSDGDFDSTDVVARGIDGRGSFLDLLDEAGPDSSEAVVTQTFRERGSGPLHVILRIEGEYRYQREDNHPAPFVTRVHAYAGKPYVRVLHTITYTGEPDQHTPQEGEHALIATQNGPLIDEEAASEDEGWTRPRDRIAGMGLGLQYAFDGPLTVTTGFRNGDWWAPDPSEIYRRTLSSEEGLSVLQTGPDPVRMPPETTSTPTQRIQGFEAVASTDDERLLEAPRSDGWIQVRGEKGGVTIGKRRFLETYPNELRVEGTTDQVQAYAWSPNAEPMSFARWSTDEDGGMVGNFAQGLTQTSEYVFHFHEENVSAPPRSVEYVLEPPVAHAPPQWYAESDVYGKWAPASSRFAAFERGMQYKFDWWRFNRDWEPWYGTFHFGDGKNYFFGGDWYEWSNNEPALDFVWWMQFMRTGNREAYQAAEAMSRHTMDVDNTHWPAGTDYRGDTNAAIDWWRAAEDSSATPYLGMGRRHGTQHWTAMMSAHVWVSGWLASYYLSGYHRGLEVAKQTGDYYRRRVFGQHGLTGRRLYLSVWNLAELYDATKDPRYRTELEDRVDRMLRLQHEQGGTLVMDRYGYAQVYAAQGLGKVYRMTGDPAVREALVRHGRWVRDNPPRNHEMESYLASISTLLMGYQLSGNRSLYREAYDRAQALTVDPLPSLDENVTQAAWAEAFEEVSHLPPSEGRRGGRAIWSATNGLRIFGWTHAYNVPYLLHYLHEEGPPEENSSSQDP